MELLKWVGQTNGYRVLPEQKHRHPPPGLVGGRNILCSPTRKLTKPPTQPTNRTNFPYFSICRRVLLVETSERERERNTACSERVRTMSGGGGSGGPHSLAFRVMRLCRPSFHSDPAPLRLHLSDLLSAEDHPSAADDSPADPSADSDLTYRSRFLLRDSTDSIGLSGLLVLPQAFGSIALLSLSLSLSLSR